MAKKAKLGSGKRFASLVKDIKKNKKVYDPEAVAASIGREKYGNKRFQKMAIKGRNRQS